MMLHAYRLTAFLESGANPRAPEFVDALRANRDAFRRRMEAVGGDHYRHSKYRLHWTRKTIRW